MKKKIISMLLVFLLVMATAIPSNANGNSEIANDKNNDGKINITLTISQGNSNGNGTGNSGFYSANTICKELSIPYFDLELYGLEDFYYNPDCYENAKPDEIFSAGVAGTREQAEGNVTLLHAYIFVTEVLCFGLGQEEAGLGLSYNTGEFENYFGFSGTSTPGSVYVTNFLGLQSANLQYYVNHEFPEAKEGLGATADQIVLSDGDHISLHLIGDTTWMVYGVSMGYFEANGEKSTVYVEKGDCVELALVYPGVSSSSNIKIYSSKGIPSSDKPKEWNSYSYKTEDNGKFIVDTSDLDAGIYYFATDAEELFYELYSVSKEPSAAIIRFVVEEPEIAVVYGDVNGDSKINAKDATTILKYAAGKVDDSIVSKAAADVNGDSRINAKDATQILKYAAGKITEFSVSQQ